MQSQKMAAANSRGRLGNTGKVNDENQNLQSKQTDVVVIGDSMTRNVIRKNLSRNQIVNSFSFPGATIEDMKDFARPIAKHKPSKIILHVGTNNISFDQHVKKKMVNLVESIKLSIRLLTLQFHR